MRVSDILRSKGNEVVTLPPTATIEQLLTTLADHGIGAVVILDDDGSLVGIVSERDVVRAARGHLEREAPLSSIMTTQVFTCTADDEVENLAREMTERRIRHLPVVDDDGLAAIVSIGDMVKARLSELQSERDQLSDYIQQ
ncbi:MAG: CBS domain-containing protein [bacterium]|nr:CBS domain-containing protein [bacterium]